MTVRCETHAGFDARDVHEALVDYFGIKGIEAFHIEYEFASTLF
jgi:hypothetical protein